MTDLATAALALSALGHEGRLRIFRFLVRAGQAGATVGQVAAHADMPASTLAHHLRILVSAGMVTQERQGREVVNRADFAEMDGLVDFLSEECCSGIAANRDVA
jgi:DNA-binding transcriptional ArsR family regulator